MWLTVWKVSYRSRRAGVMVMIMTTGMMSACAENGAKPVDKISPREGCDKVVELVVETTK